MSAAVENLVKRLHAKRVGDGWKAKCPAHDDRTPSLSINEGADGSALLKCHAGCSTDDVLTALRLTKRDLFSVASLRQSGNGTTSPPAFNWRQCVEKFSAEEQERFSEWRDYSPNFCSWLKESELIGIVDGYAALPVHDESGRVVAAHVRQADGRWRYFPAGTKTRPLVIGELLPGDAVHVFESQFDGFAFMDLSGERSGIVATRGASNGALVAGVLPKQAMVYLWPQNDAPGQKWAKDVCEHARPSCTVKVVRIKVPHKDLNDFLRAGATADDLLQAMGAAETARAAEASWTDALNAAVVTSSELASLALTPRKKFLAEWFAESDSGFIYAPRGAGKTWFALAIAEALSSGGKIGDWQAHEAVRVLYIDTEMPPDQMKERIKGMGSTERLTVLSHDILFERTGKVLNVATPEVQDAITKRCVDTGVKVLFIDNLSTGVRGMRENESDDWEKLSAWLLGLRRRKVAVIILHHSGRNGQMRGTSRREDPASWIIQLDDLNKDEFSNGERRRGACFVSRFVKRSRNCQEEIPATEWHFLTEADGQITISHKQAQTLEVFVQYVNDGISKPSDLAEAMDVRGYTISRLAKKALDQHRIKKQGHEFLPVGDTNGNS